MISFQVELSLEAANLARRNTTLGISDSSAGKFMICFAQCKLFLTCAENGAVVQYLQ
jgi:hypothetical protein